MNVVEPFVGNRSARLRSGEVLIDVESPHLSFVMSVVYATRRFHELMDAHLKAKARAELRSDAQAF